MTSPVSTSHPVPGGVLAETAWEAPHRPVAALHGFTLRAAMFAPIARGLHLRAVDLPGHGASRLHRIDMDTAVAAVAAWLEAIGPLRLVLGYSMGGRVALHLALQRPSLVPALLLLSAGLGIDDDDARHARAAADAARAAAIAEGGVAAFIDEWVDHPIAGTQRVAPTRREADRLQRLDHRADGLAAALVGLGPAAHSPLVGRLGELTMPVVWMAGALDPGYVAIARRGAAASGGTVVVVPEAGHNLVLEAADAVHATLSDLTGPR